MGRAVGLQRIGLIALGTAWLVLSLALGLELCLWLDLAGSGRLGDRGAAAAVERVAIHHQVMAMVRSGGAAPAALTADEAEHLRQVARLVLLARILGVVAVVGIVASWSRLGRRGLRAGALALSASLGGGFLAAIDWPVFFRCAHPLRFGSGDWDFDPNSHLLAALYTPAYFAVRAAPAALPLLVLALVGWTFGRSGTAPPRPPWSRSRAWAFLGLPLALALGWAAGLHLDLPFSWGHLLWIAATAGAMLGCLLVLRSRGGQLPVAVLVAAIAGLLGIALGLRQVHAQALAAVRGAAPVIAALDAEHAAGRRYRVFDDLPVAIRSALPDPPEEFGEWYYAPRSWGWLLGFRGPLAWHYEYHSAAGEWVLPSYWLPSQQ